MELVSLEWRIPLFALVPIGQITAKAAIHCGFLHWPMVLEN
jgi:hypothetical protein